LEQQTAWAATASPRVHRELDWKTICSNAADFLELTAQRAKRSSAARL
jgi:hypothetical protein